MASRWPSLARTLGGRDSLRVLMMRTLLVRRTRLRRRSCLRPAFSQSFMCIACALTNWSRVNAV